jgi:nitroreductase
MSAGAASLLFLGTAVAFRSLLKRNVDSSSSSESDKQHEALSLPPPEETLNLLKQRRSIFTKQFTGKPVPRKIIQDMLDAAQWAPNHHITEPWRFCIYESESGRESVGHLLQGLYKSSCAPPDDDGTSKKKPFSQAKYDKKLKGAMTSSHIIAICVKVQTRNPIVEEICSVAMAVQNMHLMATSYGIGAYWSSGGVHSTNHEYEYSSPVCNPRELSDFLGFDDAEPMVCLGWLYVGDYYSTSSNTKVWPSGRRSGIVNKTIWR